MTPKTLKKIDLTRRLKEDMGLTDTRAKKIVESFIEVIKDTLGSGEDILISNFGRLMVREKTARRCRNPVTGKDMIVPARKVVIFRWSPMLRKKINDVN